MHEVAVYKTIQDPDGPRRLVNRYVVDEAAIELGDWETVAVTFGIAERFLMLNHVQFDRCIARRHIPGHNVMDDEQIAVAEWRTMGGSAPVVPTVPLTCDYRLYIKKETAQGQNGKFAYAGVLDGGDIRTNSDGKLYLPEFDTPMVHRFRLWRLYMMDTRLGQYVVQNWAASGRGYVYQPVIDYHVVSVFKAQSWNWAQGRKSNGGRQAFDRAHEGNEQLGTHLYMLRTYLRGNDLDPMSAEWYRMTLPFFFASQQAANSTLQYFQGEQENPSPEQPKGWVYDPFKGAATVQADKWKSESEKHAQLIQGCIQQIDPITDTLPRKCFEDTEASARKLFQFADGVLRSRFV